MRLLIVDDDVAVRRLVTDSLEKFGVNVTAAASVTHARTALQRAAFDVAILDLTLPDGSGLDVLRIVRSLGSPHTHVIILGEAGSETGRVRAFELGADDYVVKPFFVRELTARVLAVRNRQQTAGSKLQYGGLAIDLSARQVSVHDSPVRLTAKEFDLLAFLAARPRLVFSRDELLRSVWRSAAERLYGWAEHEVLGRHLFDVVPVAGDDNDLNSAVRTLEETGRWFGEFQQTARDGSLVNVSASTSMVRDDRGESVAVVSVNRRALLDLPAPRSPNTDDEADIRRGLEGDEFDVHYQPVVALDTLRIISVEALVRWHHPVRGLLSPVGFIDTAERSGTILELGRVVFDKACRQTAEWRRSGVDLQVAVNVSTKQLADPALFEDINRTLETSGLDPHALWLEVTETALVEDVDQATELLDRLAQLGIRLAIDDFGTGWASLTYLKQFPVHALKIDQTFVRGVDHNPQDAAIARSILSLGEEFDMVVIAEGVETVEQQSALQRLGCSLAQGFLYGKPTPADAVALHHANRL